jgi:hypothetical protein
MFELVLRAGSLPMGFHTSGIRFLTPSGFLTLDAWQIVPLTRFKGEAES